MGMNREFATILSGLMENRHLSPRAVSRASARAESTINQLVDGSIPPDAEVLEDIAQVLQMELADLLVIAGIQTSPAPGRPKPYMATMEIGQLVAVASFLTPEQVGRLVKVARDFKAGSIA